MIAQLFSGREHLIERMPEPESTLTPLTPHQEEVAILESAIQSAQHKLDNAQRAIEVLRDRPCSRNEIDVTNQNYEQAKRLLDKAQFNLAQVIEKEQYRFHLAETGRQLAQIEESLTVVDLRCKKRQKEFWTEQTSDNAILQNLLRRFAATKQAMSDLQAGRKAASL